jgi:hypothetical protein
MQMKIRKREITLEQEFTVVAKDGPSIEIIEQKAGQKAIEVFRRGHAKNRLYFRCMPEKKEPFLTEISDLCFWEPAVTPPNSILRRYRRDLLKTVVNRLDKNATQAALKILTENKADNGNPGTATQTESEPAETVLYDKPAVSIKHSPKPSKLKSVIHVLKNCISRVRSLIKPNSFIAGVQK